jgi:hypothetical protein
MGKRALASVKTPTGGFKRVKIKRKAALDHSNSKKAPGNTAASQKLSTDMTQAPKYQMDMLNPNKKLDASPLNHARKYKSSKDIKIGVSGKRMSQFSQRVDKLDANQILNIDNVDFPRSRKLNKKMTK